MTTRAVQERTDDSPRWLWGMAIIFGPALLAFFLFRFLTSTPYNDVFDCGPAVHPLANAGLMLAIFLAPTALLVFAGALSRSRWLAPALLTFSCGLALFLWFVAYALHAPWPPHVICSTLSAIVGTVQ